MKNTPLSVIILTSNSESTLEECLTSLDWVSEIVIIDNNSTDDTRRIAERYKNVQIYLATSKSFAVKRNLGLKKITYDWVLYIDSDEVVSSLLRQEIAEIVSQKEAGVYRVKRDNYFLGTKMYPDTVERLFHKSLLGKWVNDIHESPIYKGEAQLLDNSLIHHTHRDISSMLQKTNEWSEIEADLRIQANHPPVKWWRLVRMAFTTAWKQFISLNLLKHGRSGLFEGYFQIVDKLIVYTKLWERQNTINK